MINITTNGFFGSHYSVYQFLLGFSFLIGRAKNKINREEFALWNKSRVFWIFPMTNKQNEKWLSTAILEKIDDYGVNIYYCEIYNQRLIK